MNWGKSIMLVFITFAVFIGVLVTVCVRQNISLVSNNYYEEELNYQQQIDELQNAAMLKDRPHIIVREKHVEITQEIQHGELKLLRPSDARFDASFVIGSARSFDLSKYPSGKYNVSLRWQSGDKIYLVRESITL
ncbi:MAG: FixH family protein [Bacteroidota bacterium]